jgi:hypothetical protein
MSEETREPRWHRNIRTAINAAKRSKLRSTFLYVADVEELLAAADAKAESVSTNDRNREGSDR